MTTRALSVSVTGLDETLVQFRSLTNRVRNLRPVFRGPIDKSVSQFFGRQFDSEGRAGGEPWAPLRRTTLRAKARVNRREMGVLRLTQRMRKSFIFGGGPMSVRIIREDYYERGSTDFKAALHQTGFTLSQWGGRAFKRPRRVPARPVVPERIPRPLVRAWERTILRHIEGKGRGFGGYS